jgi:GTP 3',8-cyclase
MRLKSAKVLRISVTDRCNLRCIYCMPEAGVKLASHADMLTYEEIILIAHAAILLGFKKVRITGGEPLVRKGLAGLVDNLSRLNPWDIALTTNGLLLSEFAAQLKAAGLDRVTVSLDTLKPERFEKITRRPGLSNVLAGIDAAKKAELQPIKVNTVIVRGINDDEIFDFVDFAKERGLELRFIELMPSSGLMPECKEIGEWKPGLVVPGSEIRKRIEEKFGALTPVEDESGVAKVFELSNGARIGLITPISEPFCADCQRLRLSSDGLLRLCLFDKQGLDLKKTLRENNADVPALLELFKRALEEKKTWDRGVICQVNHDMFRVGG